MVDFGGLADKAKDLIADNSEKIKSGVETAGNFVGEKIGHEKVDGIEDKIDGFVDKLAAEQAAKPADPA
ncbi:antitoxin [Nakamurella antarctica]|uniref:Antitoxin n=1 Tax=Nakamurella antarctica TaxID=1902245 RepID=A0A3G8ZTF3_9ACTN|nr:antitoxin [Nakamurella antarctica]AZI57081.1 antitoxin [Nakamurella antarctica]